MSVTPEEIDEANTAYIRELERVVQWQNESIIILTTGIMPAKFDLQQLRFRNQYNHYQALKAKEDMLSH
jgi:hypothetical protein